MELVRCNYVGGTQIKYVQKDAFSWNNYTITIDLSKCGTTNTVGMEGTMAYTFSEDGLNIVKVEINYQNSTHTYGLNYVGSNISLKDDYLNRPYFESYELGSNTTGISGYILELQSNTSYTITGLDNQSQSSIRFELRRGL